MNYFQLIEKINKKSFSPVNLLIGDEPYFINQICKSFLNNVIEPENKGFNEKIIYVDKKLNVNNLICELKSYPIVGHTQLYILKNVENISKLDLFESYFSNPQVSTILVLCLNKDSRALKLLKTKKWYKTINDNFIIFESKKLFENQVPNWINKYLENKGFKSSIKANMMLTDFLGNDLEKIVNEIDKLMIILEKKNIDEFDIEKHVGISRDYNSFELQKTVALKDFKKSHRILTYLIENKQPIVLIISSLSSFFMKLLILHSLSDKSKFSASSKLKINPYFFSTYSLALNNYSFENCIKIISFLKDADLASKGMPIMENANPKYLQQLIFRIIHQ